MMDTCTIQGFSTDLIVY